MFDGGTLLLEDVPESVLYAERHGRVGESSASASLPHPANVGLGRQARTSKTSRLGFARWLSNTLLDENGG